MRISVPGMVISIILVVLLLVVTPYYCISVVQWAQSENEMMSDVAGLIDRVIDTRILTDDMIADFNLALAAKPLNYSASIMRETIVVNPDPAHPGQTYSTYIMADDIYTWEQGDIITVRVEMFGESLFSAISSKMLGLHMGDSTFQISGRVR